MKAWLHQELANSFSEIIRKKKRSKEMTRGTDLVTFYPEKIIGQVEDFVKEWNRDLVACFFWRGSSWRCVIVPPNQLAPILVSEIPTESVISIVDLTLAGGFYLDFSPSANESFEVGFEAWGLYSTYAERLDKQFGGKGSYQSSSVPIKEIPYRESS